MNFAEKMMSQKKKQIDDERYFRRIRHIIMKEYGYIASKEFAKLKIGEVMDMMAEIQFDWEQEQKETEKVKQRVSRNH